MVDLGMCEQCGVNPASIQMTQMIGKDVTHIRLCESCAAEQGVSISIDSFDDAPKWDEFGSSEAFDNSEAGDEFFSEEFGDDELSFEPPKRLPIRLEPPKVKEKVKNCPNCSTTFESFTNSGLVGCSECYRAFSNSIKEIFAQTHGVASYGGKNYQDLATGTLSISQLKKELKQAVKSESFELAISLRDTIRRMKNRR